MSRELINLLLVGGCCAFYTGKMTAAEQRPPSRGRAIEFSQPRSDTVSTNLNRLGTTGNGLRDLEDDLLMPLQTLPKSSLDGLTAPAIRPAVTQPSPAQIRRARELLKRREDWVFMLPEDMVSGLTPEEIFGLRDLDPSRTDKESQSMLERFYERMREKESNGQRKGESADEDFLGLRRSDEKRNSSRTTEFGDNKDKPEGQLTESEKALKRLFNGESNGGGIFASSDKATSFAEVFGFKSEPTSERDKAFEARREEFRQLLIQSPAAGGSLAPESFESSADTALRPVLTSPLAGTSPLKSFEPGFGAAAPNVLPPSPGASTLPEFAPRTSLSTPSLAPPPPRVEPSKPALPADVSAPRRRF